MAITKIKIYDGLELAPFEAHEAWWNHAEPRDAVWMIQAVPVATGSTAKGFSQHTKVEVTRVWRTFQVIEHAPPFSQVSNTTDEDEIHYVVKNLTGARAEVNVYASVVS